MLFSSNKDVVHKQTTFTLPYHLHHLESRKLDNLMFL